MSPDAPKMSLEHHLRSKDHFQAHLGKISTFSKKCFRKILKRFATDQTVDLLSFDYDRKILKVWSKSVPAFSKKCCRWLREIWMKTKISKIMKNHHFQAHLGKISTFSKKCFRKILKRFATDQTVDLLSFDYDRKILKVWSKSVPAFSKKCCRWLREIWMKTKSQKS